MMEKVKKWLTKDNLLVVILGGALILIALWPVNKGKQTETSEQLTGVTFETTEEPEVYRKELEEKLENMLQQMEGVGKVRVMITVWQTEGNEGRSSGNLWSSKETISPTPRVEGLFVLAQGAGNAKVREDITEAAKALFDVEANKVKVGILKTTGH